MRNEITSTYGWWGALSLGLLMALQSGCASGLTPNLGAASWLKPPSLAMPWRSSTKEKESSVAAKKSADTIGQNTDPIIAKDSTPSKSSSDLAASKSAGDPPAKQGGFSFSKEAPEAMPSRAASPNRVMPASLTTEVGATKCDTCGDKECSCGESHAPRPTFKFSD